MPPASRVMQRRFAILVKVIARSYFRVYVRAQFNQSKYRLRISTTSRVMKWCIAVFTFGVDVRA